jgi:hypothetical protein
VPETALEDFGSGLAPAGDGWFVVNVRDAQWLSSEKGEKRPSGSECDFEGPASREREPPDASASASKEYPTCATDENGQRRPRSREASAPVARRWC